MNIESTPQNTIVGLSGGIGSSVAATLPKQQGHRVYDVFAQNWKDDSNDEYCNTKQDSLDAIIVADIFGIDIDIVNFATQYRDKVFAYSLREYGVGRIPDPDVLYSAEVKFKCFLDYALEQGADTITTGHCARKEVRDDVHYLLKDLDRSKGQSYLLYRLRPFQSEHAIFSLGGLEKPEVCCLVAELKLPTAAKKDSTGIYFIGERPLHEFLQRYLSTNNGKVVTPKGKAVGKHVGLTLYTPGQCKGLGISGAGEPRFVTGKNLTRNELIVVQDYNHLLLYTCSLVMSDLSFTLSERPKEGRYACKIRYRMADVPCSLYYLNDDTAELVFNEPRWAVMPGQSAVFYDGDVHLGDGVIMATDEPLIVNG